jgi:hypothetical protein
MNVRRFPLLTIPQTVVGNFTKQKNIGSMFKSERVGLISLIFLGVVFMYSCQDKCDTTDEINSGQIISKFSIDWNCNNTHTACIRNLMEFEDYAQSNNCGNESNPELPYVDFNQHSILIYNIVEDGCCIFNRNVSIDTTKRLVTYSIEHTICGCGFVIAMDIWTVDNNMVMTPKIPEDYTIDFLYE